MYIIIKLIPIPKYIIAVQIQITYHSQWYEKDAKFQVGQEFLVATQTFKSIRKEKSNKTLLHTWS